MSIGCSTVEKKIKNSIKQQKDVYEIEQEVMDFAKNKKYKGIPFPKKHNIFEKGLYKQIQIYFIEKNVMQYMKYKIKEYNKEKINE